LAFLFLLNITASVAAFCAGGVSDRKRRQVDREYQRIVLAHDGHAPMRVYYWIKAMDCRARSWLKRILPARFVKTVIQIKW